MEVSQIAQLDTHVIIGGGTPEAFGMADTAEFYDVLSDNIYRDKPRAAVRETICNAWDSHIITEQTDLPIEISLTDTEIVIRDFGPGIPDHLMHPVYCVYGASTKVKSEKETGGFGLGSKAPFAVSDHFTVVNQHADFKTVYAISRGGVATQGKPDMRPMVRVPTSETGITVTIPLKDKKDRALFETNIRAVIRQGGMLANLNGQPLPRFDYTEARKTEFCLIPSMGLYEGKVYVLYGTVMYPLTTTDEDLSALARKAGQYTCQNSILLLIAPPNSIGVTPSRESLSYSEKTTTTLTRLLQKVCRQIEAAIPAAANEMVEERLRTKGRLAFDASFNSQARVPGVLSTPAMIAKHVAITNASHVNQLEAQRFKVAARVFRDDRRLYRRAKRNHVRGAEINFKRTAMPAIRLASKMGLLKDMMLFDIHRYRLTLPGQKTRPIVEVAPEGEVKQKLCVARNLRDLRPTLSGASVGYHNEENTYIPGLVMRQWTEKNLKKLRDLCAHYKLELVEFDYEEAKKRVPVKRVKVEDKYFCLEDCKHGHFHGEPSCSEPGYYLTTWQRDEEPRLPFGEHLLGLREKYPNTVLITQKGQEEKLKKLGVRNLAEVAAERLVKLTKVREVVYGETIRHGRMFITGNIYNGSVADLVLKLSKMDMRLAKLLFPDRATPGELHREAALLWDFLSEVQSLTEETKTIVDTARAGMFKACDKMFKARSPSAIDKQFEYLEVLCGANVTYRDRYSYLPASRQAADLIETVKFLQRRTSQSKLTSRQTPANSAEIAHKEAA